MKRTLFVHAAVAATILMGGIAYADDANSFDAVNSTSPSTVSASTHVSITSQDNSTLSAEVSSDASSTGSNLGIAFEVTPHIVPGDSNDIAKIILSAKNSTTDISVSSLKISVTGLGVDYLTNCSIRNEKSLDVSLTPGPFQLSTFGTDANTVSFTTPITVPAGTEVKLVLICDVASFAPVNSHIDVQVPPPYVNATDVLGNALMAQMLLPAMMPPMNQATVVPPTSSTSAYQSPRMPNTGAGGDALSNLFTLLLSGLTAFGAGTILVRRVRHA